MSNFKDVDIEGLFAKHYSAEALEGRWQSHLKDVEEHAKELLPAITTIAEKVAVLLIDIAATTDKTKIASLQKRLGGYKRAHISYFKAMEQHARWEYVEEIWEQTIILKDLAVTLIRLIPAVLG